MTKKTVKVSLNPAKLIGFFLIAGAIVALIFFTRGNPKKSGSTLNLTANEIVLPREMGVADSGFELKNTTVTALNAKTIFDTLEEINGKQSLKASFFPSANSSVKIGNYLNDLGKDEFYRLSFWSKANAPKGKNIEVSVSGEEGSQKLGSFSFANEEGVSFFEFNFQAEKNFSDLVFTSTDGETADVWVDDIVAERINVESKEQLERVQPTIFGNTSRFNLDQSQTLADSRAEDESREEAGNEEEAKDPEEEEADSKERDSSENKLNSDTFFVTPNRKMGQIFQPGQSTISSVTLKIQKAGTGGTGDYHLQIREYDENLGIISDNVLATRKIYTDYPTSVLEEIKEQELKMKEEFDQFESDIKEGRVPNDPTVDQYPPNFTQQQIDESKAQKRKEAFALSVTKMKESFNAPYELNIPISAKLDVGRKYWIGIDSAGVKTDKRNYLKVFFGGKSGTPGSEPGFLSEKSGIWEEGSPLWFKTYYPLHAQFQGEDILSGATISDFGDKLIYRYQFDENDYSALSGFPGRKIYDLFESDFKKSDQFGNYELSPDQYAIYRFKTIYPVKKVIIRNAQYDQSLAIDFSSNNNDWKEIVANDPEEKKQTVGPLVIQPDSNANVFYLKIMPAGSSCVLSELNLEAELERSQE